MSIVTGAMAAWTGFHYWYQQRDGGSPRTARSVGDPNQRDPGLATVRCALAGHRRLSNLSD